MVDLNGLVLNELSYGVSGTVTVNGAPPTRDSAYCSLSGNQNDALGVNYLALTNLAVNGPVTNLVLAEVSYPVSGTVLVNGAPPMRDSAYCSLSGNQNDALGVITFSDSLRGYTASYTSTCANTASGFGFSLALPSGTYDVRIARSTYSTAASVNLLGVNYLAVTRLRVP